MKKILAATLAMVFLAVPFAAQAKVVNITKLDIKITTPIQMKMSMLEKAIGFFLPSKAYAASCVAANPAMSAMLGGLIAASTAGLNSGKLKLRDAGNSVLATLTLNATFGSVTNNVLTFGAIDDATAGAGSATTCTNAVVTNAGDTVFFTVDVGASGSLTMSSYAITSGDTIHITTAPTITMAAGS